MMLNASEFFMQEGVMSKTVVQRFTSDFFNI